jgi:hypothetical protein
MGDLLVLPNGGCKKIDPTPYSLWGFWDITSSYFFMRPVSINSAIFPANAAPMLPLGKRLDPLSLLVWN